MRHIFEPPPNKNQLINTESISLLNNNKMSVKHYDSEQKKWVIFPGTVGAPGKDAYTIAQENGYEGTKEDYTQALVDLPVVLDKIRNADTAPTQNSENLVISGGTWNAINEVNTSLNTKITETQNELDSKINQHISDVDSDLEALETKLQTNINNNYNTLSAKDSELESKLNSLVDLHFEVVSELPSSGKTNIIYLVPKESTGVETRNVYEEWIYVSVDGELKWELLGLIDIDLTPYLKITDYNTSSTQMKTELEQQITNLSSSQGADIAELQTEQANTISSITNTIKSLSVKREKPDGQSQVILDNNNWQWGQTIPQINIPTYSPNEFSLTITANKNNTNYNGVSAISLNLDNIYSKNLKTVDTPGKPGIYVNTTASNITITNAVTDEDSNAIVVTKGDCIVTLPTGSCAIDEIDQVIGTASQQKIYCIQKISTKVYINCALYNTVS